MGIVVKSAQGISTWVVGSMQPGEGWEAASESDEGARRLELNVQIEELGEGYLLLVTSADPSVYCDEYYDLLEDAESAARSCYGVKDWGDTNG